jgi:hypothetical protein
VPHPISRPSWITPTRSAARTVEKRCETITVMVPAGFSLFATRANRAVYERAEDGRAHEAWAAGLVAPLSDGASAPAYVGFLADEGEEGIRRACSSTTLERLAEVKHRYDTSNLFRLNVKLAPDVK